ncbi:uncharacterized protein LOC129002154 [Macrosteles quadrilineatus]|uniref:uncharacterized protein LOC129002154 n=1 Tax=Macrosteles quadrilineatus TaxID=74068 RepID=UPI0023E3142A|nr:uncharacterized protein LOC129002154 [Macrosteles quadrilineatus]XP_054285732.1 uncharacterized protein LOC129002154 [Macrosteles quadrilineatus]
MINATILFVLAFAGQNIPVSEAAGQVPPNIQMTFNHIAIVRNTVANKISNIYDKNTRATTTLISDKITAGLTEAREYVDLMVYNCVRKEFMEYHGWKNCENVKDGVTALTEMKITKDRIIGNKERESQPQQRAIQDFLNNQNAGVNLENLVNEYLKISIKFEFGQCTKYGGVMIDKAFKPYKKKNEA